jgi:hypothetical protein
MATELEEELAEWQHHLHVLAYAPPSTLQPPPPPPSSVTTDVSHSSPPPNSPTGATLDAAASAVTATADNNDDDDGNSPVGTNPATSLNSFSSLGFVMVHRVESLYESLLQLEDDYIDARSAYEKAFRRRNHHPTHHAHHTHAQHHHRQARNNSSSGSGANSSSGISSGTGSPNSSPAQLLSFLKAELASVAEQRKRAKMKRRRSVTKAARLAHVLFPEMVGWLVHCLEC